MKTYENFITDLFKSKITAEKFTRVLIKFINSIIVNDKVDYSWIHVGLSELISHHISAKKLEEYVIEINETKEKNITIEFCELINQYPHSGASKKLQDIIDEIKNIQEFIKDKIEPIIKDTIDIIIRNRPTNRVKYVINVSDLEQIIPNINKENYETFLDQKKYNL